MTESRVQDIMVSWDEELAEKCQGEEYYYLRVFANILCDARLITLDKRNHIREMLYDLENQSE